MGAFYGTYTHTVDGKGRFSIPSRIRQALPPEASDKIVLVRGMENCLWGFSVPDFTRLEQEVTALGVGTKDARAVMEMFGGTATFCEIDPQGRVLVLPKVLEMVGIRDAITIVGAIKYFSLWNPERQQERLLEIQEAYEAGMRRFFS